MARQVVDLGDKIKVPGGRATWMPGTSAAPRRRATSLYSLHLRAFMTAANGGPVHPSGDVDGLEKQWAVASGMSAGIGSRGTGAQPLGFEEFCGAHRVAMAGAVHEVHVIRAPQVSGE